MPVVKATVPIGTNCLLSHRSVWPHGGSRNSNGATRPNLEEPGNPGVISGVNREECFRVLILWTRSTLNPFYDRRPLSPLPVEHLHRIRLSPMAYSPYPVTIFGSGFCRSIAFDIAAAPLAKLLWCCQVKIIDKPSIYISRISWQCPGGVKLPADWFIFFRVTCLI
jgi:hypothetical protein